MMIRILSIATIMALMLGTMCHSAVREWKYCCDNISDGQGIYIDHQSTTVTIEGNVTTFTMWIKGDTIFSDYGPEVIVGMVELQIEGSANTAKYISFRVIEIRKIYNGTTTSTRPRMMWRRIDRESTAGTILNCVLEGPRARSPK